MSSLYPSLARKEREVISKGNRTKFKTGDLLWIIMRCMWEIPQREMFRLH